MTVEIKPKSVFGRFPYFPNEQAMLTKFIKYIERGTAIVRPEITAIRIRPFIDIRSMEWKMQKVNDSFSKAKRELNKLGV